MPSPGRRLVTRHAGRNQARRCARHPLRRRLGLVASTHCATHPVPVSVHTPHSPCPFELHTRCLCQCAHHALHSHSTAQYKPHTLHVPHALHTLHPLPTLHTLHTLHVSHAAHTHCTHAAPLGHLLRSCTGTQTEAAWCIAGRATPSPRPANHRCHHT